MKDREYRLIITLKSDLCVGSGYSYAGIIDSDICYDALGLPYIPARRLKGCLREAAELIGLSDSEICDLFGAGGASGAEGIFIENAYVDHYNELRNDIARSGKNFRTYITPQSILEQFTTVKAQTRIGKNGAEEGNSLRFTRTVNHYSPLNPQEEMRFTARVAFPDRLGEGRKAALEDTVSALRHIGMNRNRGLGSVRCTLELGAEKPTNQAPEVPEIVYVENGTVCSGMSDSNAEYTLRYTVKNVSPLILSTSNDFKTEKYISGRSVLGFFAGAYLRSSGKSAEDEEFQNLFLRNQVLFGSLYPAEKVGGGFCVYYPAPAYINRLKKTGKYVNATKDIPRTREKCPAELPEEYVSGNGNRPKRLKGRFVCLQDGKISVKEPETDIVYHHTRKSEKQEAADGNLLYPTEVLREQQYFSGEITGRGDYLQILAKLLTENTLRFGKSKSAQYGTCVLAENPVMIRKSDVKRIYPKHSYVLAVLESDAVFVNETGYTVRCEEVREQIRDRLKIQECGSDAAYSEIEAGMLTGYYSKWNLKRPAVPMVKAGSTFEFVLAEDLETNQEIFWVGEYNSEGFGRVRLVKNDGESCRIDELDSEEKPETLQTGMEQDGQMPGKAAALFRKILIGEARERLLQKAANTKLNFRSASALGRITQMLSESVSENPADSQAACRKFVHRIQSIKTDELRKKAEQIWNGMIWTGRLSDQGVPAPEGLKYLSLVEELREPYDDLVKYGDSAKTFEEEMALLWSDYLMAILIQEKYNLKYAEEHHEAD